MYATRHIPRPRVEAAVVTPGKSGTGEIADVPGFPTTKILVAINIIVFIVFAIVHRYRPFFDPLDWGRDWGPWTLNRQWWRLVTSTFLHKDVAHLFGNMLVLWILGKRLEQLLGKVILPFYLTCGVEGSIAGLAFHPEQKICGASAAVFGLAGGLINLYCLQRMHLPNSGQWKLVLLVVWTGYAIYPSSNPQIDNAAHAAGLATGLLLGGLLASRFTVTSQHRRWVFYGSTGLLLLSAVAVRYYRGYVIPLGTAALALDQNRTDDALSDVNRVLDRRPDSRLANLLAARAYVEKHDYGSAESVLHRLLAANPRDRQAVYFMAKALAGAGQCEKARQLVATSLDLEHFDPDDDDLVAISTIHTVACNFAAEGDQYLADNKPDNAIASYTKALARNPDDQQAKDGLSKALRAKDLTHDNGSRRIPAGRQP